MWCSQHKKQITYGDTDELYFHQGSAHSSSPFISTLSEEARLGLPWKLFFEDDVALVAKAEINSLNLEVE